MRLITRSDFDGLACAVLLEELGIVDEYKFVHPKDVQDGIVEVNDNDVLANIPFVPGCGLWFDHHASEYERLKIDETFKFQGSSRPAPSCARVIYDHYGADSDRLARFDQSGLMDAVDKADSADFTVDEILEPRGWVLLSFIMDPRTGLGRYRDYRISNLELMRDMIRYCRYKSVEEILEVNDVKERIRRYFSQDAPYKQMLKQFSRVDQNVIIIDLRPVDEILSGNRFVEYALFPKQNVSIRAIWGRGRQNSVFTVGHSIVNRTCQTNVGSLMLEHGGGGHEKVGTCQVSLEDGEKVFHQLIETLKTNG